MLYYVCDRRSAKMNVTPSLDSGWISARDDDKFTVFFSAFARRWRIFALVLTVCVAASILLSYLLPSYWRVEITVMPATASNSVISSSLAGALGSLGGGLGALLGRPASNQDEAIAVLRSRELFDTYATQQNLLPILYASKWDAAAGRWNVPPSRAPTLRQAFKLFDTKIRDIDLDRRTGILTLSITWKDRELAAKWARDLIALTNSQLRQRAISDAQRNMDYLDGEMRKAGAGNAQNALTAALATSYDRELQSYMSAKGQPDFAFRVIDAPTIPDERERTFPNRILFAVLGLLAGSVLGLGAVWFAERRALRRVSA